jgi:hypothetical protein
VEEFDPAAWSQAVPASSNLSSQSQSLLIPRPGQSGKSESASSLTTDLNRGAEYAKTLPASNGKVSVSMPAGFEITPVTFVGEKVPTSLFSRQG